MPSPEEGYDHIVYIRPADHPRPEYTRDDILSILGRLKASTREAGPIVMQRNIGSYFGRRGTGSYSRTNRARGYRGVSGDGYQGPSPQRGTLYGSSRFTTRVGGSNSPNWRRASSGAADREGSDHQRSAGIADVPSMEGSKGMDSAEARHNCT